MWWLLQGVFVKALGSRSLLVGADANKQPGGQWDDAANWILRRGERGPLPVLSSDTPFG